MAAKSEKDAPIVVDENGDDAAAVAVASLAKAGSSTDPAVHAVMAEHWTAVQNEDEAAAEAAVARLAELGFEL